MTTLYAMNSKAKIKPSAPESPYFDPESHSLVVVETTLVPYGKKPSMRVVTGDGEPIAQVGEHCLWYFHGAGVSPDRYGGSVKVVGVVHPGGATEGQIPAKSFTHYVLK